MANSVWTPTPGLPYRGNSTFQVSSLTDLVEILTMFPQPGFIARGESREFDTPWLPGVWRGGHAYQDRTPVAGADGFFTIGELESLRQCQTDLNDGVFEDRYFLEVNDDIEAEIDLTSVNLLHWAALAQHYNEGQRYPTRLLDVTTDSFVALYFAACDHPEEDGFVFWGRPSYNDLSDLPFTETTGVFFDVLRIRAADGGTDYLPDDDTLCFIRPPFPNLRLEAQRGVFVWIRASQGISPSGIIHLRVPAGAKTALVEELRQLNYTEESLFPS